MPYAIVHYEPEYTNSPGWAIVGEEGRVNESMIRTRAEAKLWAENMKEEGDDIDTDVYFVDGHDGDGPDWTNPIPIGW